MGNSVAYPVLRTADPADIRAEARHPCVLPEREYGRMTVGAELPAGVDGEDFLRAFGAGRLAAAIGGAVLGGPENG
ncbi:hypothetical protein [Streptomyces erythrochromogenes]|uniref:hypothetical protein n=1 Tax=Streptomyces erythrochromogenes TaxID=285574 RepID=UPI0036FEA618